MKALLATLFLFINYFGFSQNYIDLFNMYWRTSPSNKVDGLSPNVDFNTLTADFKLPIVINDNNIIIIGGEHQYNSITYDAPNFSALQKTFSSSTLQLGLEHKWNSSSKMLFLLLGRLNSDYKSISYNHSQIGALGLGTTNRSEKFAWRYGLYYSAEFMSPLFVPLFGIDWKISTKTRLKVLAPINLEFSYFPKKWFRSGIRFDGVIGSYRILENGLTGTQNSYIDKSDNNVWAFTEFHLGKNIWIHLKAGHSILRKFRIYDNNEKLALKIGPVGILDNRPNSIRLFENGYSFECRFIYRLPLDNKK